MMESILGLFMICSGGLLFCCLPSLEADVTCSIYLNTTLIFFFLVEIHSIYGSSTI